MSDIVRRMAAGSAAGIAATVVMSLGMAVAKGAGVLGEPPPKKLTRRILTLLGMRPKGASLHLATAAAHVAYGAGAGALYALLPRRARGPMTGSAFGVAIWAASYMGWVPKLGLMLPPSLDRSGRPTAMALLHVLYGASLDRALPKSESTVRTVTASA